MADEPRALLTDTERDILLENKEVTENHYYTTVSRVRSRIQKLSEDLEALEKEGNLIHELRDVVCDESATDDN